MAAIREREQATFMDRCALAFLSGLSALVLGALIWGAIATLSAQLDFDGFPAFAWVLAFAAVMGALGFLLLENFVASAVGRLWRWLIGLGGWI